MGWPQSSGFCWVFGILAGLESSLLKATGVEYDFSENHIGNNAIKYGKAKAQREILEKINDILTEEELEIVRRTRNTENHHVAKNAHPDDYMYSTAFEGLIGYLYLTNQKERLEEILNKCI